MKSLKNKLHETLFEEIGLKIWNFLGKLNL